MLANKLRQLLACLDTEQVSLKHGAIRNRTSQPRKVLAEDGRMSLVVSMYRKPFINVHSTPTRLVYKAAVT